MKGPRNLDQDLLSGPTVNADPVPGTVTVKSAVADHTAERGLTASTGTARVIVKGTTSQTAGTGQSATVRARGTVSVRESTAVLAAVGIKIITLLVHDVPECEMFKLQIKC